MVCGVLANSDIFIKLERERKCKGSFTPGLKENTDKQALLTDRIDHLNAHLR